MYCSFFSRISEPTGWSEEMKTVSRRWTSDEDSELDRLLDAGKEAAEIAVTLNRTRQAIYARLQRIYRKGAREAKSGWLKAKK
jgi:IS30 family transposase